MNSVRVPLVLGFAMVVMTGCASVPTRSAGSVSSTTATAPVVSTPIDPGPDLADPCRLLTTAQLAVLSVHVAQPPSPETDATGPQCSWRDEATDDHLGMLWPVHTSTGLADLYAHRDAQGYFQPITVREFPAVFAAGQDQRAIGACTINVGVSDRLMLTVQFVAIPNAQVKQACSTAQAAATAAIDTLKAAR